MRANGIFLGILAVSMCLGAGGAAAEAARIALPPPAKSGGVTLTQALSARSSSRDFADADLAPQQLSDLLWAVGGANRPDGKKTYPVAMNRHDMTVFVVARGGAYRYDPAAHALEPVASGDHRAATGTQPFVASAAVNLVYVQDMGLWRDHPERGEGWGYAHAGAMMQNAYLHAAGQGWSAVVRGLFDQDALKRLLRLADNQRVRLTQSIGPKKG